MTLGQRIISLGQGASGIAVVCSKTAAKSCPLRYKNAVLKVADNDPEFENEVKKLKKISNKQNKNFPLIPMYLGHFTIGTKGYILMQNAKGVYKNSKNTKQWSYFNMNERKNMLNILKSTVNRLHKIGIGHGNLHGDNIWVATMNNGSKRIFFTDFGKGYNINKMNHVLHYSLINIKIC